MTVPESKQLVDSLMIAIDSTLANVHTHTIARVTAVGEKTISCRPVINRVVDGESITLPEFIEVPPVFMQGGGSYTAYPIAIGDYCLLMISERCFDRWYQGQDYKSPAQRRMHDYSDGFALIGINPFAGAITIPSVIQQTGDTIIDGDVTINGQLTVDGKVINDHMHPYSWTSGAGSSVTGAQP